MAGGAGEGLRVPGPLPYPGRFRAARRFARGAGARRVGEEEALLLGALERQAERGPARAAGEPPPGAWDLAGRARALERAAPTWWEELCIEEARAATAARGGSSAP